MRNIKFIIGKTKIAFAFLLLIFVMLKLVSCKTSESKIDTRVNRQFILMQDNVLKMNGKVKSISDEVNGGYYITSWYYKNGVRRANRKYGERYSQNSWKYFFDKDNYIKKMKLRQRFLYEFKYDANHNLVEIDYHNWEYDSDRVSKGIFDFDSIGNLKVLIAIGGKDKGAWNSVDTLAIVKYKYNQLGQRIEMSTINRPIFGLTNTNQTESYYYEGFDKYGNATQTTRIMKNFGAVLDSLVWHSEFEYDKQGNWILQQDIGGDRIVNHKRKIVYYK